MKKILLGTSAIVLAGAVASPAAAAEWEVKVGGYKTQHIAYVNNDLDSDSGDFDGIDVKEDSEIHFSPSITLDNGLRFSARVELEGRTQSDQIDETYLSVTGSFGILRLGEDDQVAFPMQYTAPNVAAVGINSGSDTKWYGGGMLSTTTTTRPAVTHDPEGIMYYSPRMAGFQIGASYARDGQKATVQDQYDADLTNSEQALNDVWSVGANYVNSFGDANVALAAVYTAGDDAEGDKVDHWGVGGNVGFGGFTVGGSYAEYDCENDFDIDGSGCGGKDEVWDAGVSYTTGPWGFSLTYLNGDMNDGDFEIDRYEVAVSYDLAAGVNLSAYGIYSEADEAGEYGDNDDATIIGTSIALSF